MSEKKNENEKGRIKFVYPAGAWVLERIFAEHSIFFSLFSFITLLSVSMYLRQLASFLGVCW